MLKIGITGGIGSGKTTVCRIFNSLGVPVFSADIHAKKIINSNRKLRSDLIEYFGSEAFISDQYNTSFIASVVFKDKKKLQHLNSLVHPYVRKEFTEWKIDKEKHKYVLYEAAILFESGTYLDMDAIIVVDAPLAIRLKRVQKRDNSDLKSIQSRMNQQLPTDKIKEMADWVIENSDNQLLLPQVININKELKL